MNIKELRAMVLKYKSAMEEKDPLMREMFEELDIPPGVPPTPKMLEEINEKITEYMLTPEGKELESYFEDSGRYNLYYKKLMEKGGDLSGL